MPRNEEEVMRNIITLSNQLKLSRDLPQVITSFDSQTEDELSFTVIWLRVVKEDDRPIQQAFDIQTSFLKFELDRVKKVGLLRKKYLKEVTVFKVRFPSSNFLRSDHSVDLFKARQSIVIELQRVLGEYRDYNGGMIAKQHEQFLSLKALLPSLDDNDELVLENFFHSIYPVELRSVFNPFYLKKMFTMFLEAVKKNKEGAAENSIFQMSDEAGVYLLLSYKEAAVREAVIDCVREFQIPDFQLLTVISEYAESSYLGYVCLEGDPGQRENFVREISNCLGKLDF